MSSAGARALRPSSPPARWRRPLLWLAPVLLAHLWLAEQLAPRGFGSGREPPRIARIDVAFVRELQPAALPALRAPPALRRALRPAAPIAPQPAASAPVLASLAESAVSAEPLPELLPAPRPQETPGALPEAQAPQVAAAPVAPAEAAAPDAAASTVDTTAGATAVAEAANAAIAPASASVPAFEWPPSTRLDYLLTGNYRGPVEGRASVEWLMTGAHYQVHLALSVGPPFAPLVSRRLSSDGQVTGEGLVPRRYEEETRVAWHEPRVVSVMFEPGRIVLANGREVPRPAGVQDSASQFVQMTWLFTTRAGLLERGRTIELPVALPRAVDPWIYDVLDEETLFTPVGPVQAVRVRPRREARPGSDLTAEFWAAPTLQYLPVRIVIRQDADTWIDLMLARLPRQARR